MFRKLKPYRGLCLDAPSVNPPNAVGFRGIPHRAVLVAIAMALVSAAVVIAYAALLPRDNLPTSAPALGAVLLASTLSSIAGFAFSAICGVMLLHMMSDPLQVVETMMVCSIAIQSLSVAALWCDVEWRELLTFLAGGTIGLPFGVWLLLNLGHVGFREAVGTLLTDTRPTRCSNGPSRSGPAATWWTPASDFSGVTPALRLSQTIWRVTPPKKLNALTWQPIQSASPCVQRASA